MVHWIASLVAIFAAALAMRSVYHQGLEIKFSGPVEAKVRLYVPPAGARMEGTTTIVREQPVDL